MPTIVQVPLTHSPFNGTDAGNSYNVTLQVSPNAPQPGLVHPCQVDTGSCGIVIPESVLYVDGVLEKGPLPGVTRGDPITIHYQPSQNSLTGYLYTIAELAVGAGNGAPAFIARDVTVVGADNAQPGEGMMGVGFGRPSQFGTNVFLNAPGINPSYLLTTEGIWLGYTADTLPNAAEFAFQKLTPGDAPATWITPAVQITFQPAHAPAQTYNGTALLDTGVNLMMLGIGVPLDFQTVSGAQITLSWPGTSGGSILSYALTVGSPVAPDSMTGPYNVISTSIMQPKTFLPIQPPKSVDAAPATFVNTGINVIRGADFFFDANAGLIGFRLKTPNVG